MLTGMAPAWRHNDIKEFIFQSRGIFYIACEGGNLSKIYIQEIMRVHISGDAIFHRDIFSFIQKFKTRIF